MNLGGTSDGGLFDAKVAPAELADLCEPCASAEACPGSATCVQIAGNHTFCGTACPSGSECDANELCRLARGLDGVMVRACLPTAGACATATPPTSESAPLDKCGTLDGPTVFAACTSCDKDDADCQKNGCYGGWWCNTTTNRCQKPPVSCP